VVLKLTGIYKHGYMGEDEISEEPIDVRHLYTMLESSTYDDQQKASAKLAIGDIGTQDEYKAMYDKLNMSQMRHEDRPGARMSQTDIKNKLKEQGL